MYHLIQATANKNPRRNAIAPIGKNVEAATLSYEQWEVGFRGSRRSLPLADISASQGTIL